MQCSIESTRALFLALTGVLSSGAASAQVDYRLAFEPGAKHWTVEARFAGRGEDTLEFWLPRWTPGAYHLADFGRFVDTLTAVDEKGAALAVERRAPEGPFVVGGAKKAREIVVRYETRSASTGTFTNDVIDVESNRIAENYAYLNPPSVFGFVPGRIDEPVRLAIDAPAGWKVATVLVQDAEKRYLAPSYLRFEDSPFLFSPKIDRVEFTVAGKPHVVSVYGRDEEDAQTIADGCARIIAAGAKLMQGLPYDRYHFLFGFVDGSQGSGLEHSFSTLILVPSRMDVELPEGGSLHAGGAPFWGITTHEYFHLWCAERIHVAAIHHPDLTKPIETGTIWVNEGVTEYFCRHLMMHAGFIGPDELLASYVSDPLPPGLMGGSWTDVSRATAQWKGMQDVMVFALAMYARGPRTILALDLAMRRATGGAKGVLDLLRYLDANYVKKDRGFGEEELPDVLDAVAGEPAVAFYTRYMEGKDVPDPAQDLEVLGYRFVNGKLESLDTLDAAQQKARADYFSITGEP